MAHTKHQAWREFKRAGQIERIGPVKIMSEEVAPNEPRFSESEWIAADLARDANKGERLARLNDARALQFDLDAMRRAGL